MELTRSTVLRKLVLLEPDESGELQMVQLDPAVAIARCIQCRTRPRVLPCDVLPRKVYAAAVIGHEVASYCSGSRSLRQVAWGQLGERTPTHTTLHGRTEGLGAHALGRPGGHVGGAPMSAFVSDASARMPAVADVMAAHVHVDPRRYRSEPRHDRLAAVIRAVAIVTIVAGLPHAIAECRRLACAWSRSSALVFPSRLSRTAIEHPDRSARPGSGAPSPRSPDRCPTRTRSPPGASSKSRH